LFEKAIVEDMKGKGRYVSLIRSTGGKRGIMRIHPGLPNKAKN